MKFGFIMGARANTPFREVGLLLEDRGFESLFIPDHTHIPTDALVPEKFKYGMDALVTLGAIAQCTTTLQIGTAVLLVTERDPIVTAKEVASLDILSGGRMNFGVGPGWIAQEMRNHGTDPADRWRVMRERVEAMRQIWTHDIASYHGDFVDFNRITSWPKPVRKPHPPVLVAGNGPTVAKRVVAYGDEWIPMLAPGILDDIREFKKTVRKPSSDESLPVTLFGGDVADVDAYAAAGVDRVLFELSPAENGNAARTVDRIALRLGSRLR